MSLYDEVVAQVAKSRELGDGFELREVKRWTVHCAYCGIQLIGECAQTDRALEELKRRLEHRKCRNPNCVSNGGAEKRRGR